MSNSKRFKGSTARIAIIDADSVLYAEALSAEAQDFASGEYIQIKTVDQTYKDVVKRLENLVEAVGAQDAIVCISPTGVAQFRSHLLPSYKQNRNEYRRPAVLKALQGLLMERRPFGCLAVRGLEADDICGISSTKLQAVGLREPVVVSIDKDLRSVPGLLYSWRNREAGVIEITAAEADRAHLYQTLVGDTVDNYTGLPGCGPVKANLLLDELADCAPWSKWAHIVQRFKNRGFSAEYALTQARVARILRVDDWDDKLKEVRLWTPSVATLNAPSSTTSADATLSSMDVPPMNLRLADVLRKPEDTLH